MRLSPRDWFSLFGVGSLAFSLLSGATHSLAATRAQRAAEQRPVSAGGLTDVPPSLTINTEGRDIVTIYASGNVRLADDLSVDDASREFWRKVGELAPGFCRERAAHAPVAD